MQPWIDPVPALKRQLADEVIRLCDGWSQTWAAWAMQLPRSRVSEIRRGNLESVSIERLIRCLSRLGCRAEITLTHEPRKRSRLG